MKIKLWTIQSMGAWDILQSQGYLTGKLSEIPPEWKEEYEWIFHPYNKQGKRIQSTFWRLENTEIIKVDTFTAR